MARPIVVTGGAGLIGSHLVESLLSDGHRVVAIDDLSGGRTDDLPLDHERMELIVAEVGSAEARRQVDAAVADATMVFHLASPIGVARVHHAPQPTNDSILAATTQVVEACRRHRTPLLYTSSSEVYGPITGARPLTETDLVPFGPEPRWSYGRAKLASETLVADLFSDGIDCWIVRLFNVVGPRQRPDTGLVLAAMCDAAARGNPVIIHDGGHAVRAFLHVDDAVAGLRGVVEQPALRARPVNLGGDEQLSIAELGRLVASRTHPPVPVESRSTVSAFGPGFAAVNHRVPDLGRLRAVMDFHPRRTVADAVDGCLRASRPVGTPSS